MTDTTAAMSDVIDVIRVQHQQVRDLFSRASSGTGDQLASDFHELRRMLAVHETAEEEVVYPVVRSSGDEGQRVVEARTEEEDKAKRVLSELEDTDIGSAQFQTLLSQLNGAVLTHAEAEEREVFPLLERQSPEKRKDMADKFQLAEKAAPTHPHPMAGTSAVSNMVGGPILAIVDKVRDAVRGKG